MPYRHATLITVQKYGVADCGVAVWLKSVGYNSCKRHISATATAQLKLLLVTCYPLLVTCYLLLLPVTPGNAVIPLKVKSLCRNEVTVCPWVISEPPLQQSPPKSQLTP